MSEPDIDYCPRCGRPEYLWESTGCDSCAATVKEFELVGLPSVAQGWQGSPYVNGDATCLKALFALKAREMRAALKRQLTREEVIKTLLSRISNLAADEVAIVRGLLKEAVDNRALMGLANVAGRRLSDTLGLMNLFPHRGDGTGLLGI